MTTHRCSKTVHAGDLLGHQCQHTATVERLGKWYCKQHDPIEKKARDNERHALLRIEADRLSKTSRENEAVGAFLRRESPETFAELIIEMEREKQ